MTTLDIKDLPVMEELERDAMKDVRGGAKTVNEAIGDTVKMLHEIGSGQCEFVSNSYVCY
ncbi:hypothetical protein BURKHO8Y_10257 [Burkholderia sp. 8Y]|uniref:hypothetical protein n=1 Tax=Burkholderia sp. 8Y TaxID=2653133 RepID=UPI0012F0BE97|nr:hypothetical protein [Burkholderia sp. 8Y]VXB03182.1 hypothetical protein BURKHO8Y_10257 [Burkholderia sp. 8Y]